MTSLLNPRLALLTQLAISFHETRQVAFATNTPGSYVTAWECASAALDAMPQDMKQLLERDEEAHNAILQLIIDEHQSKGGDK